MISRSFLSGTVALLGRKAIAVRDRMATRPAAPAPRAEPTDEAARREQAMARFILRRVGIPPLAAIVCVLLAALPADRASAQSTPARASATARVTILASSVRIEAGRVIVSAHAQSTPVMPRLEPRARPCEDRAAPPACRLIVTDLP